MCSISSHLIYFVVICCAIFTSEFIKYKQFKKVCFFSHLFVCITFSINLDSSMDKIKKFIKNKPSKNHRIIEYNNKTYKITKQDVQAIRQYKQNKCLTSLDLYMPLNTSFSRNIREDALKVEINKHDNRRQYADFVKRMKKYEKKTPINYNEITNIWDDVLDAKHQVNINLKPITCKFNEIKVDEKAFKKAIEDKYFSEPVVMHQIEKIIPSMPRQKLSETASDLSLYYNFNERVRHFSHNNSRDKFCVVFDEKVAVYEYTNKRLIAEFKVDCKVLKTICHEFHTMIAYGKCLTILSYKEQEFQCVENKYVNLSFDKNYITFEHKDTIKDFTCKEKLISIITGRNILIHDLKIYQTVQPLKLKTELPLKIKMRKNELLITTCNAFYIYNLKDKNYTYKMTSLFTSPRFIDFVKDFIFLVDKENRITILKDNKLLKMMENTDDIIDIMVHKVLNQFIVLYREKFSIFGYDEYGCKLLKTFVSRTKKIIYHERLNWIYISSKNQIQIYT